jgi:hypothetical protein
MGVVLMASIDEFLQTGRLGAIAIGMSKDDVRGRLGEPDDVSVKKNPEIWKYGALQLTFYRGSHVEGPVLSGIGLYFHDPTASLPDPLGLTGWRPSGETTIEAFRERLTGFDPIDQGDAPSSQHLGIPSNPGLRIAFDDEGRLYGIFQSRKGPEGKQLTLFLPKDLLEAIRKEASGHGISISDLCARWIQEKAESLQKAGIR